MKTSTILLTTVVIITFGMLTAYNFSLKAAYDTGAFKNPFNDYDPIVATNISELQIKSLDRFKVKVVAGPKQGLWIRKSLKAKIKFSLVGDRLMLDWIDGENKPYSGTGNDDVILITNSLNKLKTSSNAITGHFDSYIYGTFGGVDLIGVAGENLSLEIGDLCTVNMYALRFNQVKANVGTNVIGNAKLYVDKSNEFQFAELNVPGASRLELTNPTITKTLYNVSDSATVVLNGRALEKIKN